MSEADPPHVCPSFFLIGTLSSEAQRLAFHILLAQIWSKPYAHNAEDGKARIGHLWHLMRQVALPARKWAIG